VTNGSDESLHEDQQNQSDDERYDDPSQEVEKCKRGDSSDYD
jgi:hypothetical protein